MQENGKGSLVRSMDEETNNFVYFVLSDFSSWKFYTGPSENRDASIVLSRENDSKLNFYFFADALEETTI